MEQQNLICIGICSRNREGYLTAALNSILGQEFDCQIEIIIADDGSSFDVDKCLNNVLSKYQHPLVTKTQVIHAQTELSESSNIPLGEAAMRNLIIENANSETIIWLDDDDCLIDGAIKIYANVIQKFPEIEVHYPNLIRTDESLKAIREYTYREVPRQLILPSLLLGSIFPNGGSCLKLSLLKRLSGYDTRFIVGTDYHFWVRAALAGAHFKHIPIATYLYRAHDGNAALDIEDDRFFTSNAKCCRILLEKVPPQLLFPFFDWKKDAVLADAQRLLSLLTIAKRHRDNELDEKCSEVISNTFKETLQQNQCLQQIFNSLKESTSPLDFNTTANTLAGIIRCAEDLKHTV